ncbi:MAG: phosphatase PAP2 family protein [Ahrensia sp.]|nr:phosphatase PAP2 family protein [Ahrensia sp.]
MLEYKELKLLLALVLFLPLLAIFVWLAVSPVDLSAGTVPALAKLTVSVVVLFAVSVWIRHRLRDDEDRVAIGLKRVCKAFHLICYATLPLTMSNFYMLAGSYLGADYAPPIIDPLLAHFSFAIGFDWVATVSWMNASPLVAQSLTWAYWSTLVQTPLLIFVLAALGRADRLLEYISLYALTGFVTVLIAIFYPALGAYPFYQPDFSVFSNFGAGTGVYHMLEVEALRGPGAAPVNLVEPKGIVTFPSFHTVLAIIATWSMRDIKYVFKPLLVLNVWVIVSTIPVGGHFLVDLPAGAVLAAAAIWLTARLMSPKPSDVRKPAAVPMPQQA